MRVTYVVVRRVLMKRLLDIANGKPTSRMTARNTRNVSAIHFCVQESMLSRTQQIMATEIVHK